jgi:alkylation response protein AidB-like acyl-CoA dehydrogenase
VDLSDTADEAAFRDDLRGWLAANLPADWGQRTPQAGRWDEDFSRTWSKKLYDAGYAGLTWPEAFGGAGRPPAYQAIYLEETARVGAPDHLGVIGLGMAGPTIIAHGTDEQKSQHLKAILSAEQIFCQGFSEPSSGSDLASLRTRAVRDGDHFVVNGQKVWSSYAHIADYCILLTRSDPEAEDHRALTYFLLDMRTEGVTVRPLRQLTGDPEFNEIFLEDVRIPVENVIGEVGAGWRVAMTTLLHERGTLGFALTARLDVSLQNLMATARRTGADADPVTRDKIAGLWIEMQGLRYTAYRSLAALARTGVPGPEASITKLRWSETNQRLTKLALELLGADAQIDGDDGYWAGYWQYQQLRSRGNTIEAGTSEVLRSIVAERVLGLPRSR